MPNGGSNDLRDARTKSGVHSQLVVKGMKLTSVMNDRQAVHDSHEFHERREKHAKHERAVWTDSPDEHDDQDSRGVHERSARNGPYSKLEADFAARVDFRQAVTNTSLTSLS